MKKPRMKTKAQASIEYLLIVTFALILIIPGTVLFLRYTQDQQTSVIGAQVFTAGNLLVDTAELMYSIGQNSWQTIDISFPDTVQGVTVYSGSPSELVVHYGETIISDAVFFTDIPLLNASESDCSAGCDLGISNGNYRVRIETTGTGSVIYRVVQ